MNALTRKQKQVCTNTQGTAYNLKRFQGLLKPFHRADEEVLGL